MFWRTLSHSRECKCFGEPSHSRISYNFGCSFFLGEFMRIVKLNKNYLEEILKINGHINKKGIGLALNIKDNFIFIPITSQIKYDSEKLKYLDYPLFNLTGKKSPTSISGVMNCLIFF